VEKGALGIDISFLVWQTGGVYVKQKIKNANKNER
jgi:hypothetical protein